MDIDLNFDADLDKDADGFGISTDKLVVSVDANVDVIPIVHEIEPHKEVTNLEAAVALAMEVCHWEFIFYAWCDTYLYGERQEAMLDIPLVRGSLKYIRDYWGPRFFTHKTEEARRRYYSIMAAQAALSAVERRNVTPLIQKIVYYTSIVYGEEQ